MDGRAMFTTLASRVVLSLHQDEVRRAAETLRKEGLHRQAERLESTLNRLMDAARVEEDA